MKSIKKVLEYVSFFPMLTILSNVVCYSHRVKYLLHDLKHITHNLVEPFPNIFYFTVVMHIFVWNFENLVILKT